MITGVASGPGAGRVGPYQRGKASSSSTTLFGELLKGLQLKLPLPGLSGGALSSSSAADIIRYQVAINAHCQKVELLAKVADGVLTTIKKLQSPG